MVSRLWAIPVVTCEHRSPTSSVKSEVKHSRNVLQPTSDNKRCLLSLPLVALSRPQGSPGRNQYLSRYQKFAGHLFKIHLRSPSKDAKKIHPELPFSSSNSPYPLSLFPLIRDWGWHFGEPPGVHYQKTQGLKSHRQVGSKVQIFIRQLAVSTCLSPVCYTPRFLPGFCILPTSGQGKGQ